MNIENDFEFYCYLKKYLPEKYEIVANPSTSYFTEWNFDYTVYKEGIPIQHFKGDFRLVEKGSLVDEAVALLQQFLKEE